MPIISKETIELIRSANDIVEVIGSRVQLKRAGSTVKALCPFHKEKTPSFTVNPNMQIFRCFGCGASGDVFTFIMDYEGLDFVGACRMLADRAAVQIELDENTEDASEKELLYRIHEDCTNFFRQCLLESPEAEIARAYLKERNLSDETSEAFGFGYAPERGRHMAALAKKKKYDIELMIKSGLMGQSSENGETYDRFRGRLMIPIRDTIGRTIAFTARVLRSEQSGGKYINSPETPIFKKSLVLFGLDRARKAILESRTALLCEGQIDAIRCHEAGIHTAVASQGTAITEEQAHILRRFSDSVVLVLDPDTAGQKAALRTAQIFIAAGLSVRIAQLPEGEDPDSFISQFGAEEFLLKIDSAAEAVDFTIDFLATQHDISSESGLIKASQSVLSLISKSASEVQKEHMLQQAGKRLGISSDALKSDLDKKQRFQQVDKPTRPNAAAVFDRSNMPIEEQMLIEALLVHPKLIDFAKKYICPNHLRHPLCSALLKKLFSTETIESFLNDPGAMSHDANLIRMIAQFRMEPRQHAPREVPPETQIQDLIMAIRRKDFLQKREHFRQEQRQNPTDERARMITVLTNDINICRQGWDQAEPLLIHIEEDQ